MTSITYKAEVYGKKDIEFGYYAKFPNHSAKWRKRYARAIKRGAKGRYAAREVAESLGE